MKDDHNRSQVALFEIPCNDVHYDEETRLVVLSPSSPTATKYLIEQCEFHELKVVPVVVTEKRPPLLIVHSEIYHMKIQVTKGKFYFPLVKEIFHKFSEILNPLGHV